MLPIQQIEELIALINQMDRPALLRQFNEYRATFPLDFTAEFLENQPMDRLRHLFLAICLQSQRMPEMAAGETAAA